MAGTLVNLETFSANKYMSGQFEQGEAQDIDTLDVDMISSPFGRQTGAMQIALTAAQTYTFKQANIAAGGGQGTSFNVAEAYFERHIKLQTLSVDEPFVRFIDHGTTTVTDDTGVKGELRLQANGKIGVFDTAALAGNTPTGESNDVFAVGDELLLRMHIVAGTTATWTIGIYTSATPQTLLDSFTAEGNFGAANVGRAEWGRGKIRNTLAFSMIYGNGWVSTTAFQDLGFQTANQLPAAIGAHAGSAWTAVGAASLVAAINDAVPTTRNDALDSHIAKAAASGVPDSITFTMNTLASHGIGTPLAIFPHMFIWSGTSAGVQPLYTYDAVDYTPFTAATPGAMPATTHHPHRRGKIYLVGPDTLALTEAKINAAEWGLIAITNDGASVSDRYCAQMAVLIAYTDDSEVEEDEGGGGSSAAFAQAAMMQALIAATPGRRSRSKR
jgi:hypothetical protein